MKRIYEIAVLSKGSYARTVRIYAPKHATRAIIMHDGQNVFCDDDATYKKSWRAVEVLKAAKIKNTAIIGIDSIEATRIDDYLPFHTELDAYGYPTHGGGEGLYSDYIEQIIIPYLDKRFGFEFYGMLGSSAGAIATIGMACRKNNRIKAYGMFSPPLFFCPTAYAQFFDTKPFDSTAQYVVYTGGSERIERTTAKEFNDLTPQLFVDDAFKLVNGLRKSGAQNIKLMVENTAVHDEISWRAPERVFFELFSALDNK